jgi:hypothetical protein
MAYIIENDVRALLLERDITILLEKDAGADSEAFLTQRVLFAIDVVKSKIQHRYDPAQIFIDVNIFSTSATYAIDDLIYYTESAYVAATAYVVGNRVSYLNNIYECIQNSTGNLPTNTSYWTEIIEDKRYYVANAAGTGNYPEDTAFFTAGDSRHQLILNYTLYIAVYELFKKVQPTQVPAWSISSRDEAIDGLEKIGRGTDTVLLPLYDDDNDGQTGQEITYDFPYPNQDYDF